jgi:hypothetical protein
MSSTVDINKRSIFNSTKSEIAKIFFGTLNSEKENEQQENIYPVKSQEDLVKFINDLAYSPNPSLMVALYPDYSKYITFFIETSVAQTKQILLTNALQTDPNIIITRATNYGLATAGSMVWSMLDPEQRNKAMIDASVTNPLTALLYNRLNKGMSPIPQQIISLGVMAISKIFPGQYGIPYLILDVYDEYKWYNQAMDEINNLKQFALNGKDPCEKPALNTELKCEDNKDKLIEEIDKYEERS